MPIAAKQRIAEEVADWVTTSVFVREDDLIPLPPIYKENRELKHRFLMGLLCRYYLQMDFDHESIRLMENGKQVGEQPVDFFPTLEAYDAIASSAIFNQLERMKKSEKDLSNNIFDFLYDFKTLENMVNGEIKDYVAQKNDVVVRLVNAYGMITSESNLKNLSENLSQLQQKLEEAGDGE